MNKVEVPAKPALASLAEFEIVVAVAPESGADQLVRDLQRARAKVRRLWPMPDKLPSDADVLVVEFSDRLTDRLPWTPGESRSAGVVALARSQFDYTRRLRDRIERLDENLRTIRNVERAKAILISARGMNDEAAYKFLRSQAMDRRTTVNAIATAIIDSFELLG